MTKNEYDKIRGIKRHLITTHRDCSMRVITFRRLEWIDHVAKIVDMSVGGIGIESSQRIEHGLVWFKERVGGYKTGVLVWSRQDGSRYRAGIKFMSLPRNEEECLLKQAQQSRPREPLRDPNQIISTMIESLKKERNDLHE